MKTENVTLISNAQEGNYTKWNVILILDQHYLALKEPGPGLKGGSLRYHSQVMDFILFSSAFTEFTVVISRLTTLREMCFFAELFQFYL